MDRKISIRMDYKMIRHMFVVICALCCLNSTHASRDRSDRRYHKHRYPDTQLTQTVYALKDQMAACSGMFMCGVYHGYQAHCIGRKHICDGYAQCENGADEKDCPNKSPKCNYLQLLCPDGKTCSMPCNGIPECPTGIDETNCGKTCKHGHVLCRDGKTCAVVGNGKNECADNEDELCPVLPTCKAGEISCKSKRTGKPECVPACDGHTDCENGNDEEPLLQRCRPPTPIPTTKPPDDKCCIKGKKTFNLKEGTTSQSGDLPGLTVEMVTTPTGATLPCSRTALIKVNFEKINDNPLDSCLTKPTCGRRTQLRIDLDLSSGTRNNWLFNIGDSVSNDGAGNDQDDQENNAETDGEFPNIGIFSSRGDKCNPKNRILMDAIATGVNRVTMYVSNGYIRVTNDAGLDTNECDNECMYALNGQSDNEGDINEDIYIGLNRVVKGQSSRNGAGVCSATFTWTCP